jgi:hypothetical protein
MGGGVYDKRGREKVKYIMDMIFNYQYKIDKKSKVVAGWDWQDFMMKTI